MRDEQEQKKLFAPVANVRCAQSKLAKESGRGASRETTMKTMEGQTCFGFGPIQAKVAKYLHCGRLRSADRSWVKGITSQ